MEISSLFTSVFIFSILSLIMKKIIHFGRKDVEIGPSFLHELATFLKFRMLLILIFFIL